MISYVLIADDKTGNKSTLHNCVTDSSHLKIVSVTDKDKPDSNLKYQHIEKNQLNETHLFCGHPPSTSSVATWHIQNLLNQIVSLPPPRAFGVPGQVEIQVEEEQATNTWLFGRRLRLVVVQSYTGWDWRRRLDFELRWETGAGVTSLEELWHGGAILASLSWNRTCGAYLQIPWKSNKQNLNLCRIAILAALLELNIWQYQNYTSLWQTNQLLSWS